MAGGNHCAQHGPRFGRDAVVRSSFDLLFLGYVALLRADAQPGAERARKLIVLPTGDPTHRTFQLRRQAAKGAYARASGYDVRADYGLRPATSHTGSAGTCERPRALSTSRRHDQGQIGCGSSGRREEGAGSLPAHQQGVRKRHPRGAPSPA